MERGRNNRVQLLELASKSSPHLPCSFFAYLGTLRVIPPNIVSAVSYDAISCIFSFLTNPPWCNYVKQFLSRTALECASPHDWCDHGWLFRFLVLSFHNSLGARGCLAALFLVVDQRSWWVFLFGFLRFGFFLGEVGFPYIAVFATPLLDHFKSEKTMEGRLFFVGSFPDLVCPKIRDALWVRGLFVRAR